MCSYPLLDKLRAEASWPPRTHGLLDSKREKWLAFAQAKGVLDKYWPRLTKGKETQRWEALVEISCAHFIERRLNFEVTEWFPKGKDDKEGEFLIDVSGVAVFCEVKSPGWERAVVEQEGCKSPRLRQPKHIPDEGECYENVTPIRKAVCKAYDKLPDNTPTLLVIDDDLNAPILQWERPPDLFWEPMRKALYYGPLRPPNVDTNASGCFMTREYERLSGVLFLHVDNTGRMEYLCALAVNTHAVCTMPPAMVTKVQQVGRICPQTRFNLLDESASE